MHAETVTIVLLPGLDGTGALFAPFVEALGPGCEAIVVAYPAELALDYAALEQFARARLPVGRPYFLLGESFSGPIAIALAAALPDGLVGLVLSCTFARNPHPYLAPFKSVIGLLPVKSEAAGAMLMPLLFGRHGSVEAHSALRQSLKRVAAATLRRRVRSVLEVDTTARFAGLHLPMLYLQASRDRIVFARSGAQLARLAPAMTVVSLDGPHMLLQALPAEAAREVGQFMRRVLHDAGR
ncbi:alpha/beta fold hydrolase [Massilia glaciei]|nr:alpha/beta hydrolase [Massilia glaciei]